MRQGGGPNEQFLVGRAQNFHASPARTPCACPQHHLARTARTSALPPADVLATLYGPSPIPIATAAITASAIDVMASQRIHRSSFVLLCKRRGCSWVHRYKFAQSEPSKTAVRLFSLLTKWSATFFLMLPERFGRQRPQKISQLASAAPCVEWRAISPVRGNGPVMRSRQSLRKSYGVMRCAL